MKENIAQQHEIRKVCAKFWTVIFMVIVIAGAAIGMVGKNFIETPPYMKLLSKKENIQVVEAIEQLSTKVDKIDIRVGKLETDKK